MGDVPSDFNVFDREVKSLRSSSAGAAPARCGVAYGELSTFLNSIKFWKKSSIASSHLYVLFRLRLAIDSRIQPALIEVRPKNEGG